MTTSGTCTIAVARLTVMAVDRAMRAGTVADYRPLWPRLERELGRG